MWQPDTVDDTPTQDHHTSDELFITNLYESVILDRFAVIKLHSWILHNEQMSLIYAFKPVYFLDL